MTESHRCVLERLYDRLKLPNITLIGARSTLVASQNIRTVIIMIPPAGTSEFTDITEIIYSLWLNISYLHGTSKVSYNEYLYFNHQWEGMTAITECLFDFSLKIAMCDHPFLAKENHV